LTIDERKEIIHFLRKKLRFGVIGYGSRGRFHARELERLSKHVECTAVADVRPPTDEERARFGTRFYRDYRKLLENERLDFVVVASQEAQHIEHAQAALRRRLPVYLEKAVSHRWDLAAKFYREVKRHSYPLFLGYNLRYFPAARLTEKLIRAHKIGYIQSVLCHVNTGTDWASYVFLRKFYRDAKRSGDIVLSKLTHDTEWIQHILGSEAKTCTSIISRNVWTAKPKLLIRKEKQRNINKFKTDPSSHDVCCMTGLLKNGTLYTVVFTTVGPDYERRYTFNGTKGQIETTLHTNRTDVPSASVTFWPYGKKPLKFPIKKHIGEHGGADPEIHRDFLKWVLRNPKTPVMPESILNGMIIPTSALDSSKTRRHIDCSKKLKRALILRQR
jgi:predicted dehydrogenase